MSKEEIQKPKIDPRVFLPLDHPFRIGNPYPHIKGELDEQIPNNVFYELATEVGLSSDNEVDTSILKRITFGDLETGLTYSRFLQNLKLWLFYLYCQSSEIDVEFQGWVFPENYIFDFTSINPTKRKSLSIKQKALFRKTTFNNFANFGGVTFEFTDKRVNFIDSEFYAQAEFVATFFNGGVDFGLAQFKDKVFFSHAMFGISKEASSFYYSVFDKEVSFESAVFLGNVHFGQTRFQKDVDFLAIKGNGKIKFHSIKLDKDARIIFKDLTQDSPQIIFEDCQFEKNQVIFRHCDMSKIQVERGTYEGFNLKLVIGKKKNLKDLLFLKLEMMDKIPLKQKLLNSKRKNTHH